MSNSTDRFIKRSHHKRTDICTQVYSIPTIGPRHQAQRIPRLPRRLNVEWNGETTHCQPPTVLHFVLVKLEYLTIDYRHNKAYKICFLLPRRHTKLSATDQETDATLRVNC